MPKRIVILGAGFGGVYALRRLLKTFPAGSADFTVVSRENYFLFTPLLHEVATGGLSAQTIVEPLRKIIGDACVDLRVGEVRRVRLEDRAVETSVGEIPYDVLVVATGAETNFFGTPGAAEHALSLKDVREAYEIKRRLVGAFDDAAIADAGRPPRFVIVGGGATGVELAAETAEFVHDSLMPSYRGAIARDPEIVLLQMGAELLPMFAPFMRAQALATLRKKGVDVRLMTAVASVDAAGVSLASGERLDADLVVWTAGVKPSPPAFDAEIARDRGGRLVVEPTLRLKGYLDVFVLGDLASFAQGDATLPPFAQVAVEQADAVAANVRRHLVGETLETFRYRHAGNLVSLGQWMATAEIGPFRFAGHFAWWLWRTIYLTKFISFRKKFLIALQWTINLVSPRDTSHL